MSGKVEDTSVDTVISAANKNWKRTVRLPAIEKRKLQKVFRAAGRTGTTTTTGLKIYAALDDRTYQLKRKVTNQEMKLLRIEPGTFQGEWNYMTKPIR